MIAERVDRQAARRSGPRVPLLLRQLIIATVFVIAAAACTAVGAETTAPPTTRATTTTVASTTTTQLLSAHETINTLSGLGRMTWELYDLDFLVTHAGTYGDGYAALLYPSLSHRPEYRGLAEPAVVATSSDGVRWEPLALQPNDGAGFTAQLLAVDGDRLIVFGRPLSDIGIPRTDVVHAFAWDGTAWEELPVNAPPGSLLNGGQLDVGYLSDGTPVFIGASGGAWIQSADEFAYLPAMTDDAWPNFIIRFDAISVWSRDSGVVMPTSTVAAATEHDGRFVALATPGSGGQAWTSVDGVQWQSIDPITAPWGTGDGVVSPEIVDAGGVGWVAVGSWSGHGAVWVSRDGIDWGLIDDLPGPAGWDPRVPWPPATVVDNQRILIYGRAFDARLPASPSMVWVGTVDG